ncbi:ATP-binding protein [Photobacterium sp. DNB23_23_1]|uniref:histidine kinase n=1 Tax=Photobacterium pectinilyticum TaxID=2906793 RepID=A0ABT1MZ92_9GAMM|nr:ATP-binding protein [Photobacterium sp. ZSDE20]MCQ1057805.1 ATP-binding protein [Photobacterium sp. ZSDE20]MDD1822283.1 ATP-binding protein [Photobacterium sp. ZSDE20]
MGLERMDPERHVALMQKKIDREREARKMAEMLLESKSLELYQTKQLVEQNLEQMRDKVASGSEFLSYQQKMDNLLLRFGHTFLKYQPSFGIIKELLDALIASNAASYCGINIGCDSTPALNISYFSGIDEKLVPPAKLASVGECWDEHHQLHWFSLSNSVVKGYFVTRIDERREWHTTIRKHMNLIGEMLRTSIDRQLKLEEAIRARKSAEESEKSTRDFLAMINHELRTPLNGLLGTAELLSDTELDCHQRGLLSTLHHSGELLRAIINDLLDYSKINAGMMELTVKAFDSRLMTNMLKDIFQHPANEKQLDFSIHFLPDTPQHLLGDEDRIKQIFVNLIGNAIKFTQKGFVSVTIGWQDEALKFIVRDSGCGIPKDKVGTLFQPFTQVDNSSNRQHEGTGLGLAICKKLAEQMKGWIEVDSDYGRGTTFTVTLPLAVNVSTVDEATAQQGGAHSIDDLTILVVEDLKTNQMIIKLMLGKFGITPAIADNGQKALDILEQQNFDIVLMDCRMPVLDGYATTERLRNDGYSKPIIALTAGTTKAEREECFNAGMDDILCKPYQSTELREMIEKWGT